MKKNHLFGRWLDYFIGILTETSYVIVLSIIALLILLALFKLHSMGWF